MALPPPRSLRARVRAGEAVFGLFVKAPSAAVVEALGRAGLDFVVLDAEHGAINPESLEHLIRAAQVAGCAAVVRVSSNSPAEIQRVLDQGAAGVHVPGLSSAAEASAAARAARYWPEGERGLSLSHRAAGYGVATPEDYLEGANAETLVVGHIETRAGAEEAESIAATPGLDVVFLGLADLTQSFGVPGKNDDPMVRQAADRILDAARAAGKGSGAFVSTAASARAMLQRGARYLTLGNDLALLGGAARDLLHQVRGWGGSAA